MLMIIALLAPYEFPRSTIKYYNCRSQDAFGLTSIQTRVPKRMSHMTLRLKLKKSTKVLHFPKNGWESKLLEKTVVEPRIKPVLHYSKPDQNTSLIDEQVGLELNYLPMALSIQSIYLMLL